MNQIKDQGNAVAKFNSELADRIARVFGPRLNYTLRYISNRHQIPNFRHPKDLSERLLSAMLKKDFLKYADYADKVKVREYIKKKNLSDILLKQYGNWAKAEDIDWEQLPDKFVLKANNGSGGHIICTDKSKLDIADTISSMDGILDVSHLKLVEPHYGAIEPRILCEELLGDGVVLPTDYKFTCVQGKIADIFVVSEREHGAKYSTMDTDWNVLPYTKKEFMPETIPSKPEHLKRMVEIAKSLSADFEFVRVDLYDTPRGIFFSELTFTPWGGMMNSYTNEAIKIIGDMFVDYD